MKHSFWQKYEPTKICIFFIFTSILLKILLINSHYLIVEEAYYWNYSQHLDLGYLDHPPMVAYFIYSLTKIFGNKEFIIRLSALMSWFVTAYYAYLLSESICKHSGKFSLLILSCTPYFFLFSTVMTPDPLVTACWSATLFYLHQAIIKKRMSAWFKAGISLGIGLFSKYTIALLVPATGLFLLTDKDSRNYILKPQPYFALLIALLIFFPVIYWNFSHNWESFAFQTTRRLSDHRRFSLHIIIGLYILFTTPVGALASYKIFNLENYKEIISNRNRLFLIVFGGIPLATFFLFSLVHSVKFNWIGPVMLAITPWFAALAQKKIVFNKIDLRIAWFNTCLILVSIYVALIISLSTGFPTSIYKNLLPKFINWSLLTKKFNKVALITSDANHGMPAVFVSMDTYNTNSELAFYQNLLFNKKIIPIKFPISGNHIFGLNDLMYKYWEIPNITQHPLIVISANRSDLYYQVMREQLENISIIKKIWATSAHGSQKIRPYYYFTAIWKKANNPFSVHDTKPVMPG